jgi:hypothetical protein
MGVNPHSDRPGGLSYAAVLLSVGAESDLSEALRAALGRLRFDGWVAPPEDGWVAIVPARPGSVAAERRGVVGVAEALAVELAVTTVAVRVLDDRQLVLVAWEAGQEVLRYVSDPSREPGAADDVLDDPYGGEAASALAAACGRPGAGDELEEVLAEGLDPDEEIESERLSRVLGLLGLPSWLVNAWRLPRALPTGPGRRELVRLRAGRTGPVGRLAGAAAGPGRRWRPPPPVLPDPPRGDDGMDEAAMWL